MTKPESKAGDFLLSMFFVGFGVVLGTVFFVGLGAILVFIAYELLK